MFAYDPKIVYFLKETYILTSKLKLVAESSISLIALGHDYLSHLQANASNYNLVSNGY